MPDLAFYCGKFSLWMPTSAVIKAEIPASLTTDVGGYEDRMRRHYFFVSCTSIAERFSPGVELRRKFGTGSA